MKLVNYQLQTQIEYLSDEKSTHFFKEYLQSILEDTAKPYYQRADYVGLSLQELKTKINILSKDITELQQLKKRLSIALELAKEITAEVFIANGIDRMDGTIISSLTLTKASTKTKKSIKVLNANAVMGLGYVKFEPDLEAIEKALETEKGSKELEQLVTVSSTTITIPPKIKVNMKRTSEGTATEELLTIAA